jgi:hypothetical protein
MRVLLALMPFYVPVGELNRQPAFDREDCGLGGDSEEILCHPPTKLSHPIVACPLVMWKNPHTISMSMTVPQIPVSSLQYKQ